METGEYILRAEDVTRDFYRKSEVIHAVRGVNVNIKRGTFNILCGRSGSGKTTFINMLAAIDTPTSGRIFFEDVNVALLNERTTQALAIRALKPDANMGLYDPKREEEIFATLQSYNQGPLYPDNLREIYTTILKVSKEVPA